MMIVYPLKFTTSTEELLDGLKHEARLNHLVVHQRHPSNIVVGDLNVISCICYPCMLSHWGHNYIFDAPSNNNNNNMYLKSSIQTSSIDYI